MAELVRLISASNSSLAKAPAAAKKGDEDATTATLQGSSAKLQEFATAARKAGFDDCGTIVATSESTDGDAGSTTTTSPGDTTTTSVLPFADIDLGEKLVPIPGFTYTSLPAEVRAGLISSIGRAPAITELINAIGTTSVVDGSGSSLIIFIGLNRELDKDEVQQFVAGVTSGGSKVEEGGVAGQSGWTFVGADGQQGFVTVRGTTAIMGLSDSKDHLGMVVAGLFEANPQL